jgi:hypothetical protein
MDDEGRVSIPHCLEQHHPIDGAGDLDVVLGDLLVRDTGVSQRLR